MPYFNRRQFIASTAAGLAAGQTRPPNLLFLIADQLRGDVLGCSGNSVLPTPNFDRLAREGARFENSNCAFPVCVPSRTEILTGKSACKTNVHGNEAAMDRENDPGPSFDNILHDRGYKSQYYGKWHAPYKMTRTYDNQVAAVHVRGLPDEHAEFQEFLDKNVPPRAPRPGELLENAYKRPYRPYPVDSQYAFAQAGKQPEEKHDSEEDVIGVVDVPPEYTSASFPATHALAALEQMKDGPFSLTCSIGPPHPPFLAIEKYAHLFPFEKMALPANMSHDLRWSPYRERAATMAHFHNPDYVRQLTAAYYAMVAEVDYQIGRILRKLDELKLAQNTLVVFTADHGEMLGSHGLVSKMVFFEEALRVPLLMRMPGVIQPGTVVRQPVSGIDLFDTILDYMGAKQPLRDGNSLRPAIEGRGMAGPDYRVAEWNTRSVPNYMVRTADWKLMVAKSLQFHAVDALYDMRNDPLEMRNLLGDPADKAKYAGRADEMKQRLVAWMERVQSPDLAAVKSRKLA